MKRERKNNATTKVSKPIAAIKDATKEAHAFLLAAVKPFEASLQYAAPEHKLDDEFLFAVVKPFVAPFQYAAPQHKQDDGFWLAAVRPFGAPFQYVPPTA